MRSTGSSSVIVLHGAGQGKAARAVWQAHASSADLARNSFRAAIFGQEWRPVLATAAFFFVAARHFRGGRVTWAAYHCFGGPGGWADKSQT